jgi:hypothetical protein
MPSPDKKVLINLQEIEGVVSPHREQVEEALKLRGKALEYVDDAHKLAEFMGGRVESLGLREDWAISKEIFPGVQISFVFNRADSELPSRLKVLYSGDRMLMRGDDLASATIILVNHMLRFVRVTNPNKILPDVCYRV